MTERCRVTGLGALVAASLLAACGGGDPAAAAGDGAAADPAPVAAAGGSGPDPAQAKERLLFNANVTVPDAARLLAYAETGVRFEGPPEMQFAIVNYEAELEFVADTYFHKDHKAGERHKVYGEIEYANEAGNWRILTMEIHPREAGT